MNINKDNSGIILLSVLWILAILSLLAMSLGKSSSLELSLVRGSIGRIKAYAAARAGISYTENLLIKNKTTQDTLYQCGITLADNKLPQDIFKNIKVDNETHFNIVFPAIGYDDSGKVIEAYGPSDEQAKINLNGINTSNSKILSELLQQFNVPRNLADSIATGVAAWHQETAGNSKSDGLKHKPFDHIQELLFIPGMTQVIFDQIKGYVTVFPKDVSQGGLKVNLNTASNPVIHAMAQGLLEGNNDFVKSLINQRNGPDQLPFSKDDGKASVNSASEETSGNSLRSNEGIQSSQFFNVRSIGTDNVTGATSVVSAVFYRDPTAGTLSVVSWQRE
jgi:type II secretory pathway component PulK